MTETYMDGNYTITVHIPDRTPEEQAIRDREIEESLRSSYLRMKAKGEAKIFEKQNKTK